METKCVKIKLKSGTLEKTRKWAEEINNRRPEVVKSLEKEGVKIEAAFLDEADGEHYLIYFMKASNLQKSSNISTFSKAPIDEYHKQFKKECWESSNELELLINIDLEMN